MKKSTQLRQLLAEKKLIVAPGCFDALTVLLAEKAGFSAAYLSGYGVSAGLLGMPDMGFTTIAILDFKAKKEGHPLEDTNAFLGFPKVKQWEEEFLPADQVQKKYESSSGYAF